MAHGCSVPLSDGRIFVAVKNYRDLIAWQKAMELALLVYRCTAAFPDAETYALTSQIRKAAVSVPSNVAEGQGRKSEAEFRRYLRVAHGSLREVETQILLADQLGYLPERSTTNLMELAAETGRLISGLIRVLK